MSEMFVLGRGTLGTLRGSKVRPASRDEVLQPSHSRECENALLIWEVLPIRRAHSVADVWSKFKKKLPSGELRTEGSHLQSAVKQRCRKMLKATILALFGLGRVSLLFYRGSHLASVV